MNTGNYITPETILFNASAMAGDREYKILPRGFYMSLIQDAFEELNMTSFFAEQRESFDFPTDTLTLQLPQGCFDVMNVYMFTGTECNVSNSRKVWWKRNYYTKGDGYIANDKGNNNNDPFFGNHENANIADHSLIRYENQNTVNNTLFYNIQMGNIMFSSSCRSAGNKVHIHYHGVGGDITDAPIIPRYFKTAIEDFVIEAALRFRMANEPSNARTWQAMQQMYNARLDKEGMNGSWFTAIQRVRRMNTSQRNELSEYLSRAGYASGL